MLYFDTSFVAPLVVLEETSARVAEFVRTLPAGQLTISQWTRVEFSSALGIRVRMGRLRPKEAVEADDRFEAATKRSFAVLLPTTDDFDRARAFLRQHKLGLRAGDALHLAIASNNNAETIYSLDKTMLKAGRSLGLPLSSGIRLPGYAH
jgi:predicted nucleic acid-binding protein